MKKPTKKETKKRSEKERKRAQHEPTPARKPDLAGKRKAQIEEDDLALLNDMYRNIFFNRSGKRCGAGRWGACWGPLRGGTRGNALGSAAGRDTVDRAGIRCGAGHSENNDENCGNLV